MIREATSEELTLIVRAVCRLYAKSTAPQMKYANVRKAVDVIEEAWELGYLYVTGDYAVFAKPGLIWYSNELFLMEQLVIRFQHEHNNSIDSVPLLLSEIAQKEDCIAVITGDAQRGLMEPVYTQAGYVPVGRQFIRST